MNKLTKKSFKLNQATDISNQRINMDQKGNFLSECKPLLEINKLRIKNWWIFLMLISHKTL